MPRAGGPAERARFHLTQEFQRLRVAVVGLGIALLGFVVWNVVRRPYPLATWLSVEAPREAVRNVPFPIRVTLPPQSGHAWVMAHLHWSASGREGRGFLSGGKQLPVNLEGGIFTFEIPVPARPDLQQVRAIIFLGPTARWDDRQRAVETELIPVRVKRSERTEITFQPLRSYEIVADPEVRLQEKTWGRWLAATLWVACAAFAWRGERNPRPNPQSHRPASILWRHWLSLVCLVAAVFEFVRADVHLASWLRAFAFDHRLYFERRWIQQLATLMAVGSVIAMGWFSLQRIPSPSRSLAALCLGLFAAISLAELFSLHQVDQLLAANVGLLTLGQVTKLLVAAAALFALWRGREPFTQAG